MRATQRSFTAGEVSPSVSARADLEWYSSALSKCKNAYVRAQGGVYNREGTKYIDEGGISTDGQARLISFAYNKDQSYIVMLNHKNIQIIYNDEFVKDPNDPGRRLTIQTVIENPWAVSHTRFADTITMVDGVIVPQVLKRYAHNDWRIEDIPFAIPTAKPSGVFVHLESRETGDDDRKYSYAVTAVSVDDVESLATYGSATTKFLTPDIAMEVRAGFFTADVIKKYNVYKSLAPNSGLYGFIGSCKNDFLDEAGHLVGQFLDYNYAPDMSLPPPVENEPFKEANERPRACGFHQQRRIFASTTKDPQKVFCSQTGDINSMRFSEPLRATDAIIQEVVSDTVNSFRHVVSLGGLILLTAEGELQVTQGKDAILTPLTFGVNTLSSYGSSLVVPVKAANTVIFSQDDGARLIGLNSISAAFPGDYSGGFTGTDLSIRAEHLFRGRKIVDMSYCKEPYQIIWCVLDDGKLIGLTYDKEHKIWGFHQHETQGKFTSAATIHHNGVSATYFLVERTVKNSGGDDMIVRYVERLVEREDEIGRIEDCFYVDSGKSFSGAPSTIFRGLDHLEGLDVSIFADGEVVSGKTVRGGQVTLDANASKVHIGLPYETEIITLPLDSAASSTRGDRKTVTRVHVDVLDSGNFSVESVEDSTDGALIPITPSEEESTKTLSSGSRELSVRSDVTDYGKVSIKHTDPLPLCILSITSEFERHN